MKKKLIIIFTFIFTYNIYCNDILPTQEYSWTIKFAEGQDIDNNYFINLNPLLDSLGFPMVGMSGDYFYSIPTLDDSQRSWSFCVGSFETEEEAQYYAKALKESPSLSWIKIEQLFNIYGYAGKIIIEDSIIRLGTTEIFNINYEAFISPCKNWTVFKYGNCSGYESEGQTLIVSRVEDGQERLGVIDHRMIFPKLWGTLPNGDISLFISIESSATYWDSKILLLNIETGEIIEEIYNSIITDTLKNSSGIIYKTFTQDENICYKGILKFSSY